MDIHPDPVPLRVDEFGSIRVGGSRVLFYLVVEAFKRGNAPEIIAGMFDTLQVADVYAAIAYYLRHKDEVEQFLRGVEEKAAEVRKKVEGKAPR